MATQRQQRFSPVHSDFGDRALSPALSASSQTTASLPTDLSDVSSLDGDEEFEVIEAPLSESSSDFGMASGMDGSFDDLGMRSQTSAAQSYISSARFQATTSMQPQPYGSDSQYDMGESEVSESGNVLSRNSLSTLHNSSLVEDNSAASSQLHFPDPLGESFRRVDEGRDDQTIRESTEEPSSSVAHAETSSSRAARHQDERERSAAKEAHVTEGKSPIKARHIPAENGPPPYGFPFKIDRALLASKAFRAIVGLIIMLVASGTMPVWRPDLAPAGVVSLVTKGAASPTVTRAARPEHSLATTASASSEKSSKGLIVVKSESLRGAATSSIRSKRYKDLCSQNQAVPATRSKELSVIMNRSSDLAVYAAESYSSLGEQRAATIVCQVSTVIDDSFHAALEWISSTPSKISAIDLSNVKAHTFDIPMLQRFPGRLDRPSRGAKKLMSSVGKQWKSYVQELRLLTQPLAFVLIHETNALSDEAKLAWKRVQPNGKELLATLQQKWQVWMSEVLHAYAVFVRVTGQEVEKMRADVQATFRATNKRLRQMVKDVAKMTDCNHGAARRTRGAAALRRREAQLAALDARHQQAATSTEQLVARAKASLFRMAIDSGRARLLVDEALDRIICTPARRPHDRRKATGSRARLNIRKRKRSDAVKAVKRARRRAARLFANLAGACAHRP